jgi:short-subunit dehydrogenase involved in D-alanine esterification of teichoic acids
MMTARINTILVLGAGGGIGEGVARRLHALGKQVIVTGRAADQPELARLQRDIPDIECRVVGLYSDVWPPDTRADSR